MSSIGVLADCDCSKTSLDPAKMPDQPLTPSIPENIEIHMDDEPVEITFPLGGDTVSCTCGNADCSSYCNSDTDITAEFTDNLTGMTLSSDVFRWESPKLIIKSTHKDEIGSYYVNLALKLLSNPNA